MVAQDFPEVNCVLAETQPEYSRLPIRISGAPDGAAAMCYKLTWRELLKLIWTRKLWIEQLTFHRSFQPINPSVNEPNWKEHYGKEE